MYAQKVEESRVELYSRLKPDISFLTQFEKPSSRKWFKYSALGKKKKRPLQYLPIDIHVISVLECLFFLIYKILKYELI